MSDEYLSAIDGLVRKAPAWWIASECQLLRSFPAAATRQFVLEQLPKTNNADLSFMMGEVARLASGRMSWEALSWVIETVNATYRRWQAEQQIELLWAGPSPANQIAARRIDQVLYDLISDAKQEVLLVTFAAAKIKRLTEALQKAVDRGVHISLILEFAKASEGQLSYDALKAFPATLIARVEVYQWPVEKRERNQSGHPGKLHAKLAIVDDTVLVSSANLTDDAFNRNLEVGVMVRSPAFLKSAKDYLNSLMAEGILAKLSSS